MTNATKIAPKGRAKRERLQSGYEFFLEVNIIAQLSTNLMQRSLPHGLTMPQFSVLNWFSRVATEATPGRLARALQVTNGAMTNTLQRLADKNLVSVDPHPDSGRQKQVQMTALGKRYRDDAIGHTLADIESFLTHFRVAEVQSMLPMLKRVREYLDAQRYSSE